MSRCIHCGSPDGMAHSVTCTAPASLSAEPTALGRQVDGDHYKGLGVQPLEATYLNFGYQGLLASVYCKVNKYMTRQKGDHVTNLEKAIHCLEIALETARRDQRDGDSD